MSEIIHSGSGAKRDYGLDLLKVLASLGIFFLHYQQVFDVYFENHINFFKGFYTWGYLVELFFIISGFLIYKDIDRIYRAELTLDKWMAPRLVRLLPLLAVSVLVYQMADALHVKLIGETFFIEKDFSIFRTVVAGLGLQAGGIFKRGYINNPTWYISVLLICYVLFYVLTSASRKIGCKPYYLYALMIFIGIWLRDNHIEISETARGLYSVFFGVLLAHYIKLWGVKRREILLSIFVLALTGAILIFKPETDVIDMNFASTFFVFPALIMLAEAPAVKERLNFPFLKSWSEVSYNLYIWHMPFFVVVSIVHYLTNAAFSYGKLSTMYICLAICLAGAVFSHYIIEKNLNRIFQIKK